MFALTGLNGKGGAKNKAYLLVTAKPVHGEHFYCTGMWNQASESLMASGLLRSSRLIQFSDPTHTPLLQYSPFFLEFPPFLYTLHTLYCKLLWFLGQGVSFHQFDDIGIPQSWPPPPAAPLPHQPFHLKHSMLQVSPLLPRVSGHQFDDTLIWRSCASPPPLWQRCLCPPGW